MSRAYFDAEGFYAALDGERIGRKLTWRQVAQASGVSASTLTRMAQGKRPDVDSLAALVRWSNLPIDTFMRDDEGAPAPPESLGMISTYLRSDRHLHPDTARALDEIIKAAYARLREDAG